MRREDILWIVLAIALLAGGLAIGRQFVAPAADARMDGGADLGGEVRSFREWFWENRSLDLAVQVGLILAGALGIAALLPRDREDEDA